VQERVVWEIRTLRVMWRELEMELRQSPPATAPVPDPTRIAVEQQQYHTRPVLLPREQELMIGAG
jgi:hypothetical protein